MDNVDNSEEIEVKESSKKQRDSYKTERCKVLKYDIINKTLDFDFLGYGLRLYNVEKISGENVNIKYKGTIGKSKFTYKLGNSNDV